MTMDEFYKKAYDSLNDSYAQQEQTRTEAYKNQLGLMEEERVAQDRQLEKTKMQALQNAYVSRMKTQRELPTMLATQGITGGMTESMYGDLQKSYQNARNTANGSYNDQWGTMTRSYNGNKSNLTGQYNEALTNLRSQKDRDAASRASGMFSEWQAQEQMKLQQQQMEEQKRQWQAQYDFQQRQYSDQLAPVVTGNNQPDFLPAIAYNTGAAKSGNGFTTVVSVSGGRKYDDKMRVMKDGPYVITWSDGTKTKSNTYVKPGIKK